MTKLSSIDQNKQLYAQGAIVRMRLENFVTYDSLEFSPGPNLNVIIGPNGTGKSTIVCAICLGMTGKPIVLGRAATIADYIKYGRNKATVEIELNNQNGQNFTIKRNIFKDNKSEWFLNEKVAKLKEIEELVNSLNIQVSNLCQFLPQEKVTEFAKMNSQELLENTEKAVGGLELYDKHMELKDRSKISKELERELNMVQETLSKEEQTNQRLEGQVENFREKKKNEENIIWLKRKHACLLYKSKRDEYESLKKDKDKKAKEYEEVTRKLEPKAQEKAEVEKKLSKQKQIINSKNGIIQEASTQSKQALKKLDEYSEKIAELKSDYQTKENEFKNHKVKIKEIQNSIETLKNEYEEARQSLDEIKRIEAEITAKETNTREEASKLSAKEYEIRQEMGKIKNEIDSNTRKIQDMRNIREEKMQKLRTRNAVQVHSAISWIEQNKSRFKGKVYEPMFFLINVKKQYAAKYVENSIPFADLVQMFLFELSEDLSLFMREVRHGLNLAVNAALVPDPYKYRLSDYNPPVHIDQINKYGFTTYLRDAIDAPEPILVYCSIYHKLHMIPVGDENTQKNISNVMDSISQYNFSRLYTSTHQYSITKSRYTGKITTSSSQVVESYWLTSSIDENKLRELENNGKRLVSKYKELEAELKGIMEQKKAIEAIMDELRNEKSNLNGRRYHIENIEKKIRQKQNILKSVESQNIDLAVEAKNLSSKIVEICKKKVKCYHDYADLVKNLIVLNKDKIFAIYQDAQLQSERISLENDMRNLTLQKQELEPYIENYANKLKEAKDAAKQALDSASKINGINLEKGMPNEYKQKFGELPNEINQLELEMHQLEAIAQSTYDVDERVVQDYDQRKKKIEAYTKEFQKIRDKLTSHQNNYESLKNEWLEQVESMIKELNEKYSLLFQQLKCSGEVSLGRPDNPEDFSRYGVTIRVSFRTEEKLQELTAWQQSGGEKSVSTMLYMIALQEMTKCPFRVVDEINQGMDPVNERKVFDLIVQNSSAKQYAQYFLLTPKLLPDLSFDNKTNVICVFNGPHNLPHANYNLHRFIEIKKKLNQQER